jgi:hypothetical protein
VPVSAPFFWPSEQVGTWQTLPVQILLAQSAGSLHAKLSAHGVQEPPQSLSVSSASFIPSAQCAALHLPAPSQTVPPLSLHVIPFAVSVTTHLLPVQATVAHTVFVGWQSDGTMHCTQVPAPSQSMPLSSSQCVLIAVFDVPQHPLSHVAVRHAVVGAAQSAGVLQA